MVSRLVLGRVAAVVFCTGITVGSSATVQINHSAVSAISSGERIALSAQISSDAAALRTARAYFKAEAGDRYFFAPLAEDQGDYRGVLPAPGLGAGSISYFLLAATSAGEVVKTDTYVIAVENDADALARSELRNQQDVDIDLENYERAERLLDRLGRQPKVSEPVPVASETQVASTTKVPGFSDYLVLAQQDALLAAAAPLSASAANSTSTVAGSSGSAAGSAAGGVGAGAGTGLGISTTTLIAGGAVVAGGIAAAASGGGGGGSAAPTGNQIGVTVGPLSPQQTPFSIELIQNTGATPSPLRLRYRGDDIGTWNGVGAQTFPLPDLGGELELILTADVADASFDCHFMSQGGTIAGSLFSGSAGDFFLLLPQ